MVASLHSCENPGSVVGQPLYVPEILQLWSLGAVDLHDLGQDPLAPRLPVVILPQGAKLTILAQLCQLLKFDSLTLIRMAGGIYGSQTLNGINSKWPD
jgi:hypothetical protein